MRDTPGSPTRLSRRLLLLCVGVFVVGGALFGPVGITQAPAATTYSVVSYGAVPDDAGDDTTAIQTALDAAAATGGTVTFPAGLFRVTNFLYLSSNTTVSGTTGQTILFMPPQASAKFFFFGSNLTNTTVERLTLRAGTVQDNVSGASFQKAVNCRLRNLRLENLVWGLKFGDREVATGWAIEDIVARNCRVPMYLSYMADSTFTRLDLQGVGTSGPTTDHNIYLTHDCRRLTFRDVALRRSPGYALHMWTSSVGTTSDILFENLTLDATEGRWPLVISTGWTNVTFRNTNMRMKTTTNGVCVLLQSPCDITFDGFTAVGGYALVGTYGGMSSPAQRITFRNGSYTGPSLQPPDPGGRNITDLIMQNVALNPSSGSSTTTTVSPTTTTRMTTTTIAPLPIDAGVSTRFVLLTDRTWLTVVIPLTTYLKPPHRAERARFFLDGNLVHSDAGEPFVCWLDTRDRPGGVHSLEVHALDVYGNVCAAGSKSIAW